MQWGALGHRMSDVTLGEDVGADARHGTRRTWWSRRTSLEKTFGADGRRWNRRTSVQQTVFGENGLVSATGCCRWSRRGGVELPRGHPGHFISRVPVRGSKSALQEEDRNLCVRITISATISRRGRHQVRMNINIRSSHNLTVLP